MILYDIAYCLAALLGAPVWLWKPKARRKVYYALAGDIPRRSGNEVGIMIHAVSVGEINATRELIRRLRAERSADPVHFIVTTTTDTGLARGQSLYADQADVTVVRFPLDFSWAVGRLFKNLRPKLVVLMELEVWPNFLIQCRRGGVPVIVINGRMTTASFSRYRMVRPLVGVMFQKLKRICAQDETYARRFIELGADATAVSVTGTMKFDTADVTEPSALARDLVAALRLAADKADPIWVCGSTGPGEEQIVLEEYRQLLERFPKLRLMLVPRHPERFDEVAGLISSAGFACVRRSQSAIVTSNSSIPFKVPPVTLIDTMGELRACYSLADVVFVGRTLVDLGPRQHGSDMIEPAALAKPVIVGPFTGNFAEPMEKFAAAGAMKIVADHKELGRQVAELLSDPAKADELGRRARQVVLNEQGATVRHVKVILELL